jgi:hypothetical protein
MVKLLQRLIDHPFSMPYSHRLYHKTGYIARAFPLFPLFSTYLKIGFFKGNRQDKCCEHVSPGMEYVPN